MLAIFGFFMLGIILYLSLVSLIKPRNLPPGPQALPIVGSFHLVTPTTYKKIPNFFRKYGNIFHVSIFTTNIVYLSGFELIKDVFKDRGAQFSDREFIAGTKLVKPLEGIVDAPYGPKWAAQRKLFHSAMRKTGKKDLETHIFNELDFLKDALQQFCDDREVMTPGQILNFASMNVLISFTTGSRHQYDSRRFKRLISYVLDFFLKIDNAKDPFAFLYIILPSISHIWHSPTFKSIRSCYIELIQLFHEEINEHKKNLDYNAPRDLIDHYLVPLQTSHDKYLTEDGLKMMLVDLFLAGTETTASTLKWAILYLVNNPEVQEKVHSEIASVIGKGPFSYADKSRLPYCDATILEVLRKATILPLGVSHAPIKDETIAGYNIPRKTLILASLHSVHYSSQHWKNPNEFDPENFIDDDGTVGVREAFFPFGGGRRICLGIDIARMQLFIFFVGIMQSFKFSLPTNSKLSEEGVGGLTLSPKPYQVKIENNLI